MQLLRELEDEDKASKDREARRAKENQKKKDKRRSVFLSFFSLVFPPFVTAIGRAGSRNKQRRKNAHNERPKRQPRKLPLRKSRPSSKQRRRRNGKRKSRDERRPESRLKKKERARRRNADGGLRKTRSARQNESGNVEKGTNVSRLSAEKKKSGSARLRRTARQSWQPNAQQQRRNEKSAKGRSARHAKRKMPRSVLLTKSANSNNNAQLRTLPPLAMPLRIPFASLRPLATPCLPDRVHSAPPTTQFLSRRSR